MAISARLLPMAPALVAVSMALWHGPYLIDDAYITFRYAVNLARGDGLVFNAGELVLGTSSPLFALVLGGLQTLGVTPSAAARVLGIVAASVLVLVVQELARRWVGVVGAVALGLCLAVHPDLAFTANSGMETGWSLVAVFGALLLALQGRYRWAGLVGGAAFLLRPDGFLVVLVGTASAWRRSPRRFWQLPLAAGLVVAPWLIYATVTYGSPVPHSVAAKQILHPDTPGHILLVLGEQVFYGWGMKVVGGLALVGVALGLYRKAEPLWVALWAVLYVAGLAASRIMVFPWYLAPLYPVLVLLAGYATFGVAEAWCARRRRAPQAGRRKEEPRQEAPRRFVWIVPAAVLCGFVGLFLVERGAWRVHAYDWMFGDRAAAYLRVADALRDRCRPGDVVYVGETGAIAYGLPEQYILDSSGINSPRVHQLMKTQRAAAKAAGDAAGAIRSAAALIVEEFRPRFIVSHERWLIPVLRRDAQALRGYKRLLAEDFAEYYILER